jgi:hypothetical protein
MSFSNTAETAVLTQVFVGTATGWNGNTDLWLALYESDPTEAGTAVSGETTYGSYARVTLTRATDFTVTGNTIENANIETFPTSTGATSNLTYCGIVSTASGAGTLIAYAELDNPIPTTVGVQPQFAAGALQFILN